MTDVSVLTDLPSPVATDYALTWRGTAPYRLALSQIALRDATTGFYGLGVSSASAKAKLQVTHTNSTDNAPVLGTAKGPVLISNADPSYGMNIGVSTDGHTFMQSQRYDGGGGAYNITFQEAGGNVSIGTASNDCKLTIKDAGAGQITLKDTSDVTKAYIGTSSIFGSAPANALRLRGEGGVAIGEQGQIAIFSDTSHNVGIGTITQSCKFEVVGGTLNPAAATSYAIGVANNGGANRDLVLGSDATYGYIQTWAGKPLLINGQGNAVIFGSNGIRPLADNTTPCGYAAFRWSTVYAGTGTINTSDERQKKWRGELNEAELKAAKLIAAEIGVYQWLNSVEEKGDNARLHIGVRAQKAFSILKECGLDWNAYAWCCYDKWEDEFESISEVRIVKKFETITEAVEEIDANGQKISNNVLKEIEYEVEEHFETGERRLVRAAGDSYGIRPDQLAMFLIAAQEQRLATIEDRWTDGK